VVITSVTRDDLPDGGADIWAQTIRAVRAAMPEAIIEVLTPDFQGDRFAIETVIAAQPNIFGHNLETVSRLYPLLRAQADYQRSLALLRQVADAGLVAKTSLMLGLGETLEEVEVVLRDAYATGCRIFYAGQYLRPSPRHFPIARYVTPEEFSELQDKAYAIGFTTALCAPLVRSSYHS
jgi:lipoic acid synthetase